MVTEPLNLEDWLDKIEPDTVFLFDANIRNRLGIEFTKDIYPCQKYSQLDIEQLNKEVGYNRFFLEFLNTGRFYTIAEVVEEINGYNTIIAEKSAYLTQREKNPGVYEKKEFAVRKGYLESYKQKELLDQICRLSCQISKKINHFIFKIENQRIYETISKPILGLNFLLQKTGAKEPSRTDRLLITTAFYISLYQKKPSAVMSNDNDLIKILTESCKILPSLLNYQKKIFIEELEKRPVTLYWVENNNIFYTISTRDLINTIR